MRDVDTYKIMAEVMATRLLPMNNTVAVRF